jgi:hypothetical protein
MVCLGIIQLPLVRVVIKRWLGELPQRESLLEVVFGDVPITQGANRLLRLFKI